MPLMTVGIPHKPKLRRVDRYARDRAGEALLVLRDPLAISEPFALDAQYAPILDLLDGTKTVAQVRQSLLMRGTLDVAKEALDEFVAALSDAGWLEDECFLAHWQRAHAEFLQTDPRPPRLAGTVYPGDSTTLVETLRRILPAKERIVANASLLGIVAPHAPLDTVGTLLDRTLCDLPAPESLDAVIVLGTDHGAGLLPYALTKQRYATPLGAVECAKDIVEALERRLSWVLREEIRHREGLSIELAVLYLQAVYGERCPPIVPILCGRTVLSSSDQAHHVEAFIGTLEALVDGRRVLWWASAELSHAGVAYGRPEVTSSVAADVIRRDEACLDALVRGRSELLAQRCSEAHPQGRPSGGAALTTLARLLPVGYRAEVAAYTPAPAPSLVPGSVGLAGMRFYARS